MDLDKIFASMFGLIMVFLLLAHAGELNSIIKAAGGFVTAQTQALQGVAPATGQFGQASYGVIGA